MKPRQFGNNNYYTGSAAPPPPPPNNLQPYQSTSHHKSSMPPPLTPPTQLSLSQPPSMQPPSTPVPKSLLNLAACTSSSPPSFNSNSVCNKLLNQINLLTSRSNNAPSSSQPGPWRANDGDNNNTNPANAAHSNSNKSYLRSSFGNNTTIGCANSSSSNTSSFNKNINRPDSSPTNLMQKSTLAPQGQLNQAPPFRSLNAKNNLQVSLLSDDQTQIPSSHRRVMQNNNEPTSKLLSQLQKQLSQFSSETLLPSQSPGPKDAVLASIQERVAKAGLSIGEITKTTGQSNTSLLSIPNAGYDPTVPVTSYSRPPEEDLSQACGTKEIESALSRVEARNDLSLLYPPMLLAPKSQMQINALSAGIQTGVDNELFTSEVRKIVLEECNIIYECKGCNNLFRSLANLIKHRRLYCTENNVDSGRIEMKRSICQTSFAPIDTTSGNHTLPTVLRDYDKQLSDNVGPENHVDPLNISDTFVGQKHTLNRKSDNISRDLRAYRESPSSRKYDPLPPDKVTLPSTSSQTNLSRLLQSQPKNRLPVTRNTDAILGALRSAKQDKNNLIFVEGDRKDINCSFNNLSEQLVRNSSLAKTLLNEKARSIGSELRLSSQELSPTENTNIAQQAEGSLSKRPAPKRKFLEDCIQKVKRDKLKTNEDVSQNTSDSRDSTNPEPVIGPRTCSTNMDDSGADSDALMIDLDVPTDSSKGRSWIDKTASRRDSTAASSTASSSSSSRLDISSSALLKALTRPVDSKPSYMDSAQQTKLSPDVKPSGKHLKMLGNSETDQELDANRQESERSGQQTDSTSEDSNESSQDDNDENDAADEEEDNEDEDFNDDDEDDDDEIIGDDAGEDEPRDDATTDSECIQKGVSLKTNSGKTGLPSSAPVPSSGSSSGGSGGIMKLKIQLKAQPDEKSKVYRIV